MGVEDEEHCPDVFVAVSHRNSWKIVTLSGGLELTGFLEGLLFTKDTSLENIKNYHHGNSQPAYFSDHYIQPINEQAFEKIMGYLQKYK